MIETGRVEIRRVLPAAIDEVFSWWTQPALLERWMSPLGSVEAEVDLQVGGALRIVMRDGPIEIEHRGEYVEIDPPRLLVFTWQSRYTDGPSLVSVSLEPEGKAFTRAIIVHTKLPPAAAASHAGGWGGMLERLERALIAT